MFTTHTPTLRDCGVATVTPERALVISSISGSPHRLSDTMMPRALSTVVAEHTVYTPADGGVPRLGSGRLIGPESLADIIDYLDDTAARHTMSSFIPAHVLGQGPDFVAWHVPGRVRPMFFRLNGRAHALHVAWPNLLFVAKGGGLTLAALADATRPDEDTPVYHAPLMNHSADAGLCYGSVAHPAMPTTGNLGEYEKAVFESNFSHPNGGNHLRYRHLKTADDTIDSDTHFAFYQSLANRHLKRFPKRHLLRMNTTVRAFIEQHTRAR